MPGFELSRRRFLETLGISAAGLAGASLLGSQSNAEAAAKPPNFVLILIDDMGWVDCGCFGNRFHETPNIDRLASQGVRFTQAYAAAPLCSATRASIMTGKYPARLHITGAFVYPQGFAPQEATPATTANPWNKLAIPRGPNYLALEEITLAEELKRAGYTTAHFGKWHLGPEPYYPEKQGFDSNFAGGHYPSPPSYFYPYRIANVTTGAEGEYLTDRLAEEACKFLETHREGPFFLYLANYAVHMPLQAKQEMIARYEAKDATEQEKHNATYAAMVQSVDEGVGRVMAKLDELGLSDNTIVLFMSDNGGLTRTKYTEGDRVTSNAPLRDGKATLWEGGIREPMIVRWPGVVKPGTTCDTPVSSVDFCPTILEMAGAKASKDHVMDGESIVPVLKQTGAPQRDALFWYFPHYVLPNPAGAAEQFHVSPCAAMRQGDYKLIKFFEGRLELYNLREDLSETTNLAEQMPRKAAEMSRRIDDWLTSVGAQRVIPNPKYNPNFRVAGWTASADAQMALAGGVMAMKSTGGDPFMMSPPVTGVEGPVTAHLRVKLATRGQGQFFWRNPTPANFERARCVFFDLVHDGQWHEYVLPLDAKGRIDQVRFDPGSGPGDIEIDWIRLYAGKLKPEEITPQTKPVAAWEFEG